MSLFIGTQAALVKLIIKILLLSSLNSETMAALLCWKVLRLLFAGVYCVNWFFDNGVIGGNECTVFLKDFR